MLAAVRAVRLDDPASVVVAVPVADPEVCRSLGAEADDVVCLRTPERLGAVGLWYEDFSQTTDEEVRELLKRSRRPPVARAPEGDPPAHRRADRLRLADRAGNGGALRAARGGEPRHARVLPRARRDHEAADRGGGLHRRRGRGRLARRVPRQPLRARRRATTGAPIRRCPTSGASRCGCGATPRSPSSSTLLREWNDALPRGRAAVGSTGWTCTAFTLDGGGGRVPRRDRPRGRAARPRALRLLRPVRARPAGVRVRGRDRRGRAVRAAGGRAAARAPADRQPTPTRRLSTRTRHFFAEQNARLVANAEEYYRAMFRGGVESWNLRDRHMAADARGADRASGAHVGADEGRRLGAQLAPRRRARRPSWASRAS